MPASMNAMPENEVRWLLLDEYTSTEKVPVAVCADGVNRGAAWLGNVVFAEHDVEVTLD
jgi:hypothetical protein